MPTGLEFGLTSGGGFGVQGHAGLNMLPPRHSRDLGTVRCMRGVVDGAQLLE